MPFHIQAIPMFYTPESMAELEELATQYSGAERVAFTMAMCMTWNLAAHLMELNAKEETKDA